MEESGMEIDFCAWDAAEFAFAHQLESYLPELNSRLVGQVFKGLWTCGCIFDEDVGYPQDPSLVAHFELDEPAVLEFDGFHFDIWFYNTSHCKLGFDSLTMKEESCQGCDWRFFALRPLVGHKVTAVKCTRFREGFFDSVARGMVEDGNRPDGGDYFGKLILEFEGGVQISVFGDNEYMDVWVEESRKK